MTPSPVLEQAEAPQLLGRALLARILAPRASESLDVRSLYLVESATNTKRAHSLSRTSVSLGAETQVSFCTYFNAFPASYWRRWSVLKSVVLRLELSGRGRVDVYRSKADASRIHVEGKAFGEQAGALEFQIDLGPFEDGGWLWFDITTDSEVALEAGGWYAPVEAPGKGTVAVGIPTFNRPTDAVKALEALASDPLVLSVVDAVIMPDQGTRKVVDEPGFAEARDALGGLLSIHDQPNLGGSGGYSRIMYEALKTTEAPYILFMDDDIEIEPDSILRVLAMSRFAKKPMLVGGQMLNLQERSHLHTMGEVVNRADFMWTGAPNTEYDHDFSRYPLADRDNSAKLHRRIDVDYNGWWMCMIPRQVAQEIGQPLPLFIKWDDAEYGLRAGKAGYPTVTMPGAAIWHMAWSDKDDAIDWQAYFHLRNRLVVAAIHSPGSRVGLVASTVKATLKHLLCLEYSTVAIQNKAIEDFLAGPQHVANQLATALPEVHAMRKSFPDAVVLPSATELPLPSHAGVGAVGEPKNPVAKVVRLAKGLVRNVKAADPDAAVRPQLNVPTIDARWFLLSQVDGVTVTTADGRGVVYRKRNPKQAAELLKTALRLRRELLEQFDSVAADYRLAAPELASRERWEKVFGV
jgi:galactofuranosylgalactofuranosylrhamnosyl-N-acetylglucosaminyl-diphospho-decaprenol beta-1,5/1,6-galactofuranosyltransferase